jgi:hypothetical protein
MPVKKGLPKNDFFSGRNEKLAFSGSIFHKDRAAGGAGGLSSTMAAEEEMQSMMEQLFQREKGNLQIHYDKHHLLYRSTLLLELGIRTAMAPVTF